MKYLVTVMVLFFASNVQAEGAKSSATMKEPGTTKLEASLNPKGELVFYGIDTAGKPVVLSAADGYDVLKKWLRQLVRLVQAQ